MRSRTCLVVLMVLGITGLGVAAQQGGGVEQGLMKLERLWNDVAGIKKDRATLEQILADDFSYTHSTGVHEQQDSGDRRHDVESVDVFKN